MGVPQKVTSLGRWVFQNTKASTVLILKLKQKYESLFGRRLSHGVKCLSASYVDSPSVWSAESGSPSEIRTKEMVPKTHV